MRFLFWNTNKKQIPGLIAQLTEQFKIDVLALAENEIPINLLLKSVNEHNTGPETFTSPFNPSERITVLCKLPNDSIRPLADEGGVSVRHVVPPLGEDIILVIAHLPSKLYKNDQDQAFNSVRIVRMIEEYERKLGHSRTVVVGDFNMNPFEPGVVAADTFHAVMSRQIAAKGSRMVDRQQRRFFYNPMWSRMGDHTKGPPGTYHYGSGGQICYFWNTFDQVLVRPELLRSFNDDDLHVVTKIGQINLFTDSNLPDTNVASDHLPLVFNLNL